VPGSTARGIVAKVRERFARAPSENSSLSDSEILNRVAAGGARFRQVVLTENRRVMISVTDRGRTLRLHVSFREAPASVLRAVGRLLSTRAAGERSRARAELHAHLAKVASSIPPAPPRPTVPYRPLASDLPHLERLLQEFRTVNADFFGGELPEVPMRLSGRMKRRNGHFTSHPLEIAISRTLCEAGAAGEAERTLRHEMIHLWQHVKVRRVGHGADFRQWAQKLGIHPRAARKVVWSRELTVNS
jgi:predicted SprT family Zn-dependent metalloprotease